MLASALGLDPGQEFHPIFRSKNMQQSFCYPVSTRLMLWNGLFLVV